jgi:hypothetical protein
MVFSSINPNAEDRDTMLKCWRANGMAALKARTNPLALLTYKVWAHESTLRLAIKRSSTDSIGDVCI